MSIDHDKINRVIAGEARLSVADALALYHEASLHDLGRWAQAVCNRIHGRDTRTYIIDRNINYTNVCSAHCTFCAFRRDEREPDAYVLSKAQLRQKIQELVDLGGTQVLLQGGMHPNLPITYYEDLLSWIKTQFPMIHLHAFSPPEFVEFVALFELDGFDASSCTPPGHSDRLSSEVWVAKLDAIMARLQAAGLDSIPGGGGEIFMPAIRDRISRGKASADQWLEVMRSAHRHGMYTSATMMFGHIESVADRMDHMDRVRQAQDQAMAQDWPGRYLAFIAWPFQRDNTPMGRLPVWDASRGSFPGEDVHDPKFAKVIRQAGATEYLRMQAIARLFLDNIHSIGASWVTMGPHIGQLGLFYGANDMGSVMIEENVVSAAGTTYCLDEALLCRLIREAGFTPAQRDNQYGILKAYPGPDAPDLKVTDWSEHRVAHLQQHDATTSLQVITS